MIKALIFDFDGLILDTETPEFEAWQAVYDEFEQELLISDWIQWVGGAGASDFDPVRRLEVLLARPVDGFAVRQKASQHSLALVLQQSVLPGVREYLQTAREIGLGLAVASSSPHNWVDGHLRRLGLMDYFQHVVCAEDVPRVKPHPDLFLKALGSLKVLPNEALIFEDSQNGVKAANAAGISVVAVPNQVTRQLGVSGADKLLSSLADMPLEELLRNVE